MPPPFRDFSNPQRYAPVPESIPEEDVDFPRSSADSLDNDSNNGKIKLGDLKNTKNRSGHKREYSAPAYVPGVRNSGDVEAYLDGITDAEQELLAASRQYDLDGGELPSSEEEAVKRGKRERRNRRRSLQQVRGVGSGGWLRRYWWRTLLAVGIVLVLLVWGFLNFAGKAVMGGRKESEIQDSSSWFPSPKGGSLEDWAEDYHKAQLMVERMSLLEKINVTTGVGWRMGLCVGNTGPAEFAGFPSLCLQDGPLGIRFADQISAFPAGITTGATWNRDLMRERGEALGAEARAKGVNVLVGPSMGPLGMMPAGGRNWESFGSDPVLQGVAAAETIRGIQSNGVMATAKHYVLNEQEHFRQPHEWGIASAMSSNIDDRALHEVFVWPFADAIRADVASVMCAYQQVNNSHACENSKLLNGILKDELGFQGFVQSDWLAQRSGINSAIGGLDMSMPGDGLHWADGQSLWGPELTRAVLNTSVPMERLNDMVTRIVAAWYHLRQDQWEEQGPNFSSWTNDDVGWLHHGSAEDDQYATVNFHVNAQGEGDDAHSHIARKVAAEGMVLVKNVDQVLPLSRAPSSSSSEPYRVGLYGDDLGPATGPNACPDRGCNQGTLAMGWGSGTVDFPYLVSPLEALTQAWADGVEVEALTRNMVMPSDVANKDLCLVFASADSGEGYIQTQGIPADRPNLFLQKGGDTLVDAVARNCGGGKGRTVVVIHSVGPVVVDPWIDLPGVHGVVFAHLPGQESGNALVDVLFGDVDASGRLPYTVGKSLEDYGKSAQVLYEPNAPVPQVDFTDALYIDHRHFDRYNITPRYEFGFGLSYTSWALSDLGITPLQSKSRLPSHRLPDPVTPPQYDTTIPAGDLVTYPADFRIVPGYIYPYLSSMEGTTPSNYTFYPDNYTTTPHPPSAAGGGLGGHPSLYDEVARVQATVSNTGQRAGQTVVQVYVSFPSDVTEEGDWIEVHPESEQNKKTKVVRAQEAIEFPERVLRNFSKVTVEAGEQETVTMTLTRKDLSYWSAREQNWVLPNGEFEIQVGSSSRDLPLRGRF